MFYPIIVGIACLIDGFATGVWVGKKWVSKATLDAALKSAVARAATLPSGGVAAIATEVADDVTAVANKTSEVVTAVSGSAASLAHGADDLRKLLSAVTK